MAIKIEEWVDGDVLTADDLNDSFGGVSKGHAEQANKILKATGAYENGDTTASENYTTSAGVNGTVNEDEITLTVTNTTLYDPNTVNNPSNFFDGSDATYAETTAGANGTQTKDLGHTFDSVFVKDIDLYVTGNSVNNAGAEGVRIYLYIDEGSGWTQEALLVDNFYTSTSGSYNQRYNLNKTIQGAYVRIQIYSDASSTTKTFRWYNMEYIIDGVTDSVFNTNYYECKGGSGSYENSSILSDTNTITLDGTEKGIQIYSDHETPTNTSVTVDVSDGTSTLVSGATFTGKFTDVLALTGVTSGTLQLTFNLITTDVSATPTQSGWGVYVIK